MTNNITVSVASTIYPVKRGSFNLADKVDEVSRFGCTLQDSTGVAHFRKGQQIAVADSSGTIFTGVINTSEEDKVPAQTMIRHSIDTLDPTEKARKRTAGKQYTGQYAGIVVADMAKNVLASEGVTANYAIDVDDSQSDFAAGTLSNTTATADGNLELSPAGTAVSIVLDTEGEFDAGTHTGTDWISGALRPTATKAIKIVARCTLDTGNLYSYIKIWSGSHAQSNGAFLAYDLFIDPACPEQKIAVDIVYTDNSTLRDNFVYFDAQNMSPHPNTSLEGLATGQWYAREFWLNNFNGKTIAFVQIGVEGDKPGTYTGWVRNVRITDVSRVLEQTIFSTSLNTAQQISSSGYSSTVLSVVDTYDIPYYTSQGEGSGPWSSANQWSSASTSISAAGIYRDSLLSYVADVPEGTFLHIKYTLDYPSSSAAAYLCTNNAALPSLPAGLKIASRSVILIAQFTRDPGASPLTSPEIAPSLTSISLTINPSYNMTKTDVEFACTQASDWTQAGTTLTNTQNSFLLTKVLSLIQYMNTFDTSYGTTSLYGTSSPAVTLSNRTVAITTATGTDAKIKLTDAGQFQDFTLEVDVLVSSNYNISVVYRTTGWQNNNDTYAYSVEVTTTTVKLGKGTNSASGGGSYTQLATYSITLTSGNWYRLKIVVSSTTHDVYINEFRVINLTSESTYTATGYVGLRIYNNSGSTRTAQFDNFGITKTLTGTWTSPSISLAGATTYGSSLVTWRDQRQDTTNNTLLVESTVNGGSSWQTLTNGGAISGLTAGQSLSGVNAQIRITLTATTAASMPQIDNLIVRVLQKFDASGTRISPALLLTSAGRVGKTLVAWNASTPSGTTLVIATSPNGSSSWTDRSNGDPIASIVEQAAPVLDTFTSDTSGNYTQGNFGGTTGTFVWDTANSRLTGSGGSVGTLQYTALSYVDGIAWGDFDQADGSGLMVNRNTASGYGYYIQIYDASAGGTPNTCKLYRRSGGSSSQVGSTATIAFVRGTYHRFSLDSRAGGLTVRMDGATIITYTDGSPLGTGQMGMCLGALLRCYNLRIQGLGEDLTGDNSYTRATLTSTDATKTPQLQNLTLAALSPDIGIGALIADTLDYRDTHIDADMDDLSTRSDYNWLIRSDNSLFFNARQLTPAPWILVSSDPLLLLASLRVSSKGDTYRNRQKLTGVLDPVTGEPTYTVTRNNTGGFTGTTTQAQYAVDEGGSGIVENVEDVSDRNMTVAQAEAYGDDLLQIHGVIGRTIRFTTRRTGLRVGQYLTAFVPEHNLNDASLLIMSIDVAAVIVAEGANSTMEYRYTVEATEGTNTGSWAKLMSTVLK